MSLRHLLPAALDPSSEEARRWLARELARAEYQEPLLDRIGTWVRDLLGAVDEAASRVGLIDPRLALVLLVVVVGMLALALSRLRRNVGGTTSAGAVFGDVRRTAQEHRDAAQEAASRGDWDEVVLEAVRAVAAGLAERGLLAEQSDLTVHELTGQAAAAYPALADRLRTTGRVFDETRYGGRPADEARALEALAVEREVAGATPTAVPGRAPVTAVPR